MKKTINQPQAQQLLILQRHQHHLLATLPSKQEQLKGLITPFQKVQEGKKKQSKVWRRNAT